MQGLEVTKPALVQKPIVEEPVVEEVSTPVTKKKRKLRRKRQVNENFRNVRFEKES